MKTKVIVFSLVAILIMLSSCKGQNTQTEQPQTEAPPQTSEQTDGEPTPSDSPATNVVTEPSPSAPGSNPGNVVSGNHVDERFELVSLVFRLAGNPEYSETSTAYQREVQSTFIGFRSHPVVTYTTQNLQFGYDAVFNMAIHLEKVGESFSLVENHAFLVENAGGFIRWTEMNAVRFVELLNDFYLETNFADFFHEHIESYKEHSTRFENDVLSQIDFEWFKQHGFNPDNMKAVLSPSSSRNGYGGWVYATAPEDTIVYAALPVTDDYKGYLSFVVHEFSHAIGNPLAAVWYTENPEFRHWADSSVDLDRYPEYANGFTMACEYVTRAFVIKYMADTAKMDLMQLFHAEKSQGFPYIQNVYAMVTAHEVIDYIWDIGTILGTDEYIIGDEQSINIGGRIIKWHIVDLLGHELSLEGFNSSEVGNAFGSQTGDVLYVIFGGSEYLYIDLGSAQNHGWSAEHRMYSVFQLDRL